MAEPDLQLFSSLRYDPLLTPLSANTEAWDREIKHPSPFYMLPYHRDRLLQAAEHFGWIVAAEVIRGPNGFTHLLKKLTETVDTQSTKPVRIRVLLSKDGTITVEPSPTPDSSREALYPGRLPPPKSASKMKVSPLTGGALELGDGDSVHGDPPIDEPFEVMPDTMKTTPSPYTSYKTTSRDMYTNSRQRVGIRDFTARQEVLLVSGNGEIMEGSLTSVYFWRDGRWTTPNVASGGQIGTTRRWALERGFCVEGVVKADSLADGEECWISNGVKGFLPGKAKLL
ncbi:Aminodeoxychorismate lyase [Lachnellula occidentalis]|uniref:Aminodeoxychorismate lyase n=1 Tax=Lachnellula occidentalis TaxID=215460 RepID=A0A8H8UD39_9HELO|nr:Aminodeoxychorismate lyase [Lachnellula occidentalis]